MHTSLRIGLTRLLVTAALGVLCWAGESAEAASFLLNGPSGTSRISADLSLSSTNGLTDVDHPTDLPAAGSTAVSQSRVSALTTYDLSESAFAFGFDHVRRNAAPHTGSEVELFFRPDSDVDFALSGLYSAVDGTGHPITFSVLLNDLTTSSTIYASYDFSRDTPNEVFVLGQSGGEFSFVFGLPTGRLRSGHDYSLSVLARIEGDPLSDVGVFRAAGSLRLEFVPEPSTALLLGLGLASLSAGARRAKSRIDPFPSARDSRFKPPSDRRPVARAPIRTPSGDGPRRTSAASRRFA